MSVLNRDKAHFKNHDHPSAPSTETSPVKETGQPAPILGLARVKQAAETLTISVAKLYAMMDRGDIAYVKIGRARRIAWQEVARFIERQTITGRQPERS